MFRRLENIEDLKQLVVEDKAARDVGAATLDRYPIRFVLFDNFRDCYDFIEYLQYDRGVRIESVDKWIDSNYPDLMITHVELADRVEEFIKEKSPQDCAIAPFSELARFYDNNRKKSFDALLKTIKAIQSSPEGFVQHQRVYIPIVGLEGKMEAFNNDTQTNIWRLVSSDKDLTYRLILTDQKDFGVKGLENQYTVIHNIRQWLNIWHHTDQQATPHIICMSRAIYANAQYAQPDNAFSFQVCNNAYEFLVDGLQLSFGGMQQEKSDGDNWERLAEQIDVSNGFSFPKFVNTYFGIDDVDDYKDFIQLWYGHSAIFDRWLLARYYAQKPDANSYLCHVLDSTNNYGGNELIENMVGYITEVDSEMDVRRYCMQYAAKQHVVLSESTESLVMHRLQALPAKVGYVSALKYFTGLSRSEKDILVNWLGKGNITPAAIKQVYPDLYSYLKEGVGIAAGVPTWVEDYFKAYKKAKISNQYTDEIAGLINELNASEAAFDGWYNTFSTTYTQLMDRGDIEVYFWIDGLGVDWVPLVKQIIAERKDHLIFLNEVKIARAQLPTKTENNKIDLQRLLPGGHPLEKVGDLDALAHRTDNISPYSIHKELKIVREAIETVLDKFIGKKIAIISDHGLTYLSQLVDGKNMTGVESDHGGRIAIRTDSKNSVDASYFRLDDGKTLCALKHNSLCAKVHLGQGSHGGCTPEEVLVPIFIISNSPAASDWTAELLTKEVSGTNPCVRFHIKNLPSSDMPYVDYNGNQYALHQVDDDIYESDALVLNNDETEIMLRIGEKMVIYYIQINTGIEENDLFGF